MAVHPHACGDDSSLYYRVLHSIRFTPTPVGTILLPERLNGSTPVHPHACGDDNIASFRWLPCSGSPPRLWGRWLPHAFAHRAIRFTPTPVGTMLFVHATIANNAVHPHACGDDSASTTRTGAASGSPPRLWGRCKCATSDPASWRFTPTPVGTILEETALYRDLDQRKTVEVSKCTTGFTTDTHGESLLIIRLVN